MIKKHNRILILMEPEEFKVNNLNIFRSHVPLLLNGLVHRMISI